MKLKIAIQGISGSFHDVAAREYFGNDIEIMECITFKDVCESLKYDRSEVAIMAIENSLTGSLLHNYSLLSNYNFKITGEVFVHIQMNLMVYPKVKFEEVEYIQSHPVAIQQCRDFLDSLSTSVNIIESYDTAGSAKQISDKKLKNTAAIASKEVAKQYGLEIIKERIEDHKKNFTRFLVLSKAGTYSRDNNKASISFELGHTVGALANVLQIFKEHNINLSKIQSIPIMGKPYEYSFHIDIDWSDYEGYEKAINLVLKSVSHLNVLGEYKKGNYDKLPVNRDVKKNISQQGINFKEDNFVSVPEYEHSYEYGVKSISSLLRNWNIF